MGVRASDVFLTEDAQRSLQQLGGSTDGRLQAVARRVRSLAAVLRANVLHGEVVRGRFIPVEMRHRGFDNLYAEDLPSFWRLLYSIVERAGERQVIILAIVDHATYDKWFPNRGR